LLHGWEGELLHGGGARCCTVGALAGEMYGQIMAPCKVANCCTVGALAGETAQ